MILKMAGLSECFNIGSIVSCKTCYNMEIEGEVLAFDPQTKMLILKCPASNGRLHLNDVHIVNLALVGDIQVKKEVNSIPETPMTLNLQMLNTRVRNQIEIKRRLVTGMTNAVPPEGQKLFLAITKTIKEVCWQGNNILVFNHIQITPPYKSENVTSLNGDQGQALIHIRKVVEKFAQDQAADEGPSANANPSTPANQTSAV